MTKKIDYSKNFTAFLRDLYVVEGAYGPRPVVPPFLAAWLKCAFPSPSGDPLARNIGDFRTKKEGKSALAGAVALYMASRAAYSEVVIAASDIDQAKDRVLRAVKFAVERGPLADHAKIYKDTIELDTHSIIQAIPTDWKGAAGGNYSAVIFDELHAWTFEGQRRLFDELVIPPTVKTGVRWIASYAGWEGESLLLKEWWDRALLGEKVNESLPIFYNKAASLLAFVDTGDSSWRMPWMTPEYIAETKESERPNTFRRIWLNEWVSGESQFLPAGTWEACYSPDVRPLAPGEKARLVMGADASTSRDFTALVGVEYNDKTNTSDVRHVKIWRPKRGLFRQHKPTIDLEATIAAEVLEMHKAGQVAAVICDPFQLHTSIIAWERAGIKVIELPQSSGRVEADQSLYDSVIARAVRHYNDPTLNEHIKNAVAIETPRGLRIAKEKTSQKIDACVALSMALHGALDLQKTAIGLLTVQPDPWEASDEDLLFYFASHGQITESHPPGITWRNCKKHNAGCAACIREMEAEGIFKLEKEMVESGFYNSNNEANRQNSQPNITNLGEVKHDSIIENFKESIRRRLAGND
jgi:hypothetical protein